MEQKPFVTQELEKAAAIYQQRSAVYGDNYKRFGDMVMPIMGKGITLESPSDFSRFAILTFMMAKISRYANNFVQGGHDDSLDDLSVYCMMLKELDTEARAKAAV